MARIVPSALARLALCAAHQPKIATGAPRKRPPGNGNAAAG